MKVSIFTVEHRNGYKINWSNQQIDMVVDMYLNQGMSTTKIGEKFSVGNGTIRKLIEANGHKTRTLHDQRIIYSRDSYYFQEINTEEKAYWLGFLYADANINEKENKVRLGLSSIDEDHLTKFKNSLKSNAPIKHSEKTVGEKTYFTSFVSIADNIMIKDLIKQGCTAKKSFTLQFPNSSIVPEKLLSHFIRGYFDGDGSINKSQPYKNTKRDEYRISFIGTLNFLENIKNLLNCNHLKLEDKNTHFCLQINGNLQVLNILENIVYKDATIYLTRKFNKFLDLKSMYK